MASSVDFDGVTSSVRIVCEGVISSEGYSGVFAKLREGMVKNSNAKVKLHHNF